MKLSICILSYNRPLQLGDLLKSIDYRGSHNIEINICDDFSPRHQEISKVIAECKELLGINIKFISHLKNLGYDETLYDLVEMAEGDWIVFMGDDDLFVPGAIEKYLNFLTKPEAIEIGYVLKSHYNINKKNEKEYFRYYKEDRYFPPGEDAYLSLFRKSVFISGFLIRSDYAKKYNTHDLNGTLLLQLYLLARVVLLHGSAYSRELFTYQYTFNIYEKNEVMFDREKNKFVERVATKAVSLAFLKSYLKVIDYIDGTCGIQLREKILLDISKYSYPSLAIQRHLGIFDFTDYCISLYKLGFAKSIYFYIYFLMLIVLGKNICDQLIYGLRNKLGSTPIL
jgi:abequosyltransferase